MWDLYESYDTQKRHAWTVINYSGWPAEHFRNIFQETATLSIFPWSAKGSTYFSHQHLAPSLQEIELAICNIKPLTEPRGWMALQSICSKLCFYLWILLRKAVEYYRELLLEFFKLALLWFFHQWFLRECHLWFLLEFLLTIHQANFQVFSMNLKKICAVVPTGIIPGSFSRDSLNNFSDDFIINCCKDA